MAKEKANSKSKAKNRLFNLGAVEVSLVPTGANNRKILITKDLSREDKVEEILKQILEGKLENETEIEEVVKGADLSKEEMNAVKGAVKLLQTAGKKMPGDIMKRLMDMVGKVKKSKKDDPEEPEEVTKGKEGQGGTMDPELTAILKENQKILKEMKDENKSLREELTKEKDIRILKEFEDEAKTMGFKGGKAVKIAKMLKDTKEKLGEDSYKEMKAEFQALNVQKEASNLFTELGSSVNGTPDFTSKLEKSVENIRKEHTNLTKEQAEEMAFEADPDLYNEYLNDNPIQYYGHNRG